LPVQQVLPVQKRPEWQLVQLAQPELQAWQQLVLQLAWRQPVLRQAWQRVLQQQVWLEP
jgi:hypothetical protein